MSDFHKNGKKIGEIGRDGIFRKKVHLPKHLFRKYDAWGIGADLFSLLPGQGCDEIRIFDTFEGKLYTVSLKKALDNKITGEFGEYGTQVFIPRSAFTAKVFTIKN